MAVIELFRTTHPATTQCGAGVVRTLTAGQVLKLEVGADELSDTVPEGETWEVQANINIVVS